jgi:hypothetical protein
MLNLKMYILIKHLSLKGSIAYGFISRKILVKINSSTHVK